MKLSRIGLLSLLAALPLVAQVDNKLSLDREQLSTRVAEAQDTLAGENAQAASASVLKRQMEERQMRAGTLPEVTPEQRKAEATNQERMASALRRLTDEGAQKVAQSAATSPSIQAVSGPAPQPLTPTPLAQPAPKKETRIIVTADAMIWDSKNSIMVAAGNVDVQHPEFHLTSDELEVHMKKSEKGAKPAPAAPVGEAGMNTSQLEKVIARGSKVIIEKVDEKGELVSGRCGLLIHNGVTEETTLRIWPQVAKGLQKQVADEAGTIMIITKEGALVTKGRSHAEIIQGDEKPKKPKSDAPPTPPAPAAPQQ
jgi:hypothetical protein